jgi:hypothetical protein
MLSPYIYKLAAELLQQNQGVNYLEIGSFDGTGIAGLCKQFPDRMFYSIDPFIEDGHTCHLTDKPKGYRILNICNQFYKNIENIKNIFHYEITTSEFITHFKLPDIKILLIDGDHNFQGVWTDLALACLFAQQKEIIVIMDDVKKQSVDKAISLFRAFHKIDLIKTECADMIYFKLVL